jgi:predicted dienelactone hydrolase
MIGGMGTFAGAGDPSAAPGRIPCLPEPTGPCPAGTTALYLSDASRPDPWAAGVSARDAEDLASHGYVVAGIDHTYESDATAFPMGGSPPASPVRHPARAGARR